MSAQMTTIRLYGKLGAAFGRVHRFALDTNSPAEAIRALDSQHRGFREWLMGAKGRGLTFAVFAGKRNLSEGDLKKPVCDEDIRIAPILIGAKAGALQTILGAVLIVVGALISSWGESPEIGGPIMNTGIGLMAGGIVQMLSPQPKGRNGQESSNQPSYIFNGAVNTEAQGHPVPLLYGRMIVGSAVISAGIEANDYTPSTTGVTAGTPNWHPNNPYETPPGGN